MEVKEAISRIRGALIARSGHRWSVVRGRGTASAWFHLDAPPHTRMDPAVLAHARRDLARLLGFDTEPGEAYAVGPPMYEEFVRRAEGTWKGRRS